ncbi:MAG: glycosyltransferase [Rhodocyclaceae bacterium]|nr:glycosyltransferase [Rhodocyclaceae bacterium]
MPIVVIVCNALDDFTRIQRRIHTDSPAASRKVFQMCQALRLVGVRPYVLSLGRGRADGLGDAFVPRVCRVGGVPTIYAPFSHRRGWSELLSLFGLLVPLSRLARHPQRAVIFYNRIPAYLLALIAAVHQGYRCFLDLEDGDVQPLAPPRSLKARLSQFVPAQFDRHCRDGALLACRALAGLTSVRPVHCYYGTAVGDVGVSRWSAPTITCLMSGTLSPDTGATLLAEAIRRLRVRQPVWASALRFEITGKGESVSEFERLAAEPGLPQVRVHGRTTDARYIEILRGCEVGLALKPVGGALADTTFPSKVIEFAGSGLLVLSTDISDVRRLLRYGARYIERNDPDLLIERLAELVLDRGSAAHCAQQGRLAAERHCTPEGAGQDLREFLFRGRI